MRHCSTCTCATDTNLQVLLDVVAREPGLTTRQIYRRCDLGVTYRRMQQILAQAVAGGELRAVAVALDRQGRRKYFFPRDDAPRPAHAGIYDAVAEA